MEVTCRDERLQAKVEGVDPNIFLVFSIHEPIYLPSIPSIPSTPSTFLRRVIKNERGMLVNGG
jgi:hypothetical protein